MPDQGAVYDLAAKFRAQAAALDQATADQITRRYGRAWQSLSKRIEDTAEQITREVAEGKMVRPVLGTRLNRLRDLRREVEREILKVSDAASVAVKAGQSQAVLAAQLHSEQLLAAAVAESSAGIAAGFEAVSVAPANELIGFLADGSPLSDLMRDLGPQAGRDLENAMVDGMVQGLNPTAVARRARDALGGNMVRALTIARTEMLRSYRTASLETYRANKDVVKGWVWQSALERRTCATCFAMHGTKHSVDEVLDDHPRGRCAAIPLTKTWSELGFGEGIPDTHFNPTLGTKVFDGLDDATKRQILGPGKFDLYKKGDITLRDLVGRRFDPKWGTMRYEVSTTDAISNAATRKAANAKWVAQQKIRKARKAGQAVPGDGPDYPFDPARLARAYDEEGLGGAHSKMVFRDPDSDDLWLFKPQERFRAEVDVSTARIMRAAGMEAPDTFVIELDGQVGSIQRMFGTKASRRAKFRGGFDPTKLSAEDALRLQEHHVMDWLLGNHDGHADQFLRLSGRLDQMIAIDKGQAFKFFGQDVLDWTYNPNGGFIGDTVYNQFMRAYAEGRPVALRTVDDLAPLFKRLDGITRTAWDDMLRPYAEEAAKRGFLATGDVQTFLSRTWSRKTSIESDFRDLYARAMEQRTARLRPADLPADLAGLLKGMDGAKSSSVGWANSNMPAVHDIEAGARQAVRSYTGSSYYDMNTRLRSGGTPTPTMKKLDAAMRPLPEDVILHRKTGIQAFGDLDGLQGAAGSVWADPAYLSTSVGKPVWHGEIELRIRANAGTQGVWAKPMSQHATENELILGRGTRMFIHSVRREGNRWIVEAETIP